MGFLTTTLAYGVNIQRYLAVIKTMNRLKTAVWSLVLVLGGCKEPTLVPLSGGPGPPPGPSSSGSPLDAPKATPTGIAEEKSGSEPGYQRYMPGEPDIKSKSTSSSSIDSYGSSVPAPSGSTYGGSVPTSPYGSPSTGTPSYGGQGGMSAPYGGSAPNGGSPYGTTGSSPYSGYSPGR